ncbi:MAG TPA: putative lipid II flippase FtsW [Thermoanaerobaculia bacterium]|nr:MAG: Lipid II flippase FtsW [Acidobacteria bacterium ADurb.Bin051]HNU83218.1 putative lipid II flippase FtsW [Thermoanaerobaculia bacterium]HPA95212.1 putative lipid II flippase FtsW [Thermoanaerobaculia bacterium]HQN38079.1 putative lipid II flippase FtsW [Thermoanaerobaculia bacterium]
MARKLVYDRVLFTAVVMLVALGLAMVYSASAVQARGQAFNPYLLRQALAAAIGFGLMLLAMHVDYRRLREPFAVWGLLLGVLALLVLVLLGPELNATRRWLFIAGLTFQPSELAKLALVLYLASQLARKEDRVSSSELLLPAGLVTGLLAGLILLEPDLGTAVLLVATAGTMLFLAGLPWRHILLGAAALVPLAALAIAAAPYRRQRLLTFLDPESDPLGSGFQVLQSLIAVGSGGLFGRGPGESLQKLHFLPYPFTDFIYAILAEELGFVGAVFVLLLFAAVLWRGVRAGVNAPDSFGRYLAWGLTTVLVLQALINMSVVLGLFPTKGMPLPFLSYGGSSIVVTLVLCGLLLNLSQHA